MNMKMFEENLEKNLQGLREELKARTFQPYLTEEPICREELPHETYWTGKEPRPGTMDLRASILRRDNRTCQICGKTTPTKLLQVDHRRPVRRFKQMEDAQTLENLQTVCWKCHKAKTKADQQGESRVR
jgi:5-methylcytosine-specific restriction endonuclease McrA